MVYLKVWDICPAQLCWGFSQRRMEWWRASQTACPPCWPSWRKHTTSQAAQYCSTLWVKPAWRGRKHLLAESKNNKKKTKIPSSDVGLHTELIPVLFVNGSFNLWTQSSQNIGILTMLEHFTLACLLLLLAANVFFANLVDGFSPKINCKKWKYIEK